VKSQEIQATLRTDQPEALLNKEAWVSQMRYSLARQLECHTHSTSSEVEAEKRWLLSRRLKGDTDDLGNASRWEYSAPIIKKNKGAFDVNHYTLELPAGVAMAMFGQMSTAAQEDDQMRHEVVTDATDNLLPFFPSFRIDLHELLNRQRCN
jgi:hypothetical protein